MDLEKKRILGFIVQALRILLLGAGFSIVSCATSRIPWREKVSPGYFASIPLETAYPDAEAIVLLDEAFVEVFPREKYSFSEYTRHTVIKILKETGFKYANVMIPYQGDEKVSGIKARTLFPDGRILSLSSNHIFDTHLLQKSVFYSDLRAKRFTLPGIEKGCIVEYTWQKTVMSFTLWTQWDFQYEIPVLRSRYVLRCPSDWEIKWKTYGQTIEPSFEKMPSGMKSDRIWQLENIPPFVPEPAMPSQTGAPIRLMFSPIGMTTWQEVGLWFSKLCENQFKADADIRNKVQVLTSEIEDPKEKLQAIFEFIRDNIRYLAIEVGIGRYQPHRASEVFRHRYGDCKDMMGLLITMAKEIGFKVYPAFVLTRSQGEIDTSLVSPAWFNHAIALAEFSDGTRIWMDPTERGCLFGELPWYDQNVSGLVIRENGKSEFVQTPMVSPEENRVFRKWYIHVDSSGMGRGEVFIEFYGAQAMEMRNVFLRFSPRETKNWWETQFLYRFPHVECDSFYFSSLLPSSNSLECWIEFSSASLWMEREKKKAFCPGEIALYDWHSAFPENKRTFPIVFSYPLCIEDHIELKFPKTWKFSSSLSMDSLVFPFGTYAWKGELASPGEFHYMRKFYLKTTHIKPEDYKQFRFFLNEVATQDRKAFFLER